MKNRERLIKCGQGRKRNEERGPGSPKSIKQRGPKVSIPAVLLRCGPAHHHHLCSGLSLRSGLTSCVKSPSPGWWQERPGTPTARTTDCKEPPGPAGDCHAMLTPSLWLPICFSELCLCLPEPTLSWPLLCLSLWVCQSICLSWSDALEGQGWPRQCYRAQWPQLSSCLQSCGLIPSSPPRAGDFTLQHQAGWTEPSQVEKPHSSVFPSGPDLTDTLDVCTHPVPGEIPISWGSVLK